jgi:hypothetical protein
VALAGTLGLPALHLLEHAGEAARAAAPLTHRQHVRWLLFEALHHASVPHTRGGVRAHRHLADGTPVPVDDAPAPDPTHGRGAAAHLGVLAINGSRFVVAPRIAPLIARDLPPLRSRPIVTTLPQAHAPRGPPVPAGSIA